MARAITARAPTRIDFGGGWTDVPPYYQEQGGCVCNLAIARHATARLVAEQSTARAEVIGTLGGGDENSLGWAAMRRSGVQGVTLDLRRDFPFGAGLGGSSAAGVAAVAGFAAWSGETLSRDEIARRSRAIEVEDLGVAGGWQDHFAAAYGGALAQYYSDEVRVEPIPLSPRLREELERRCVIGYTGQSRISGETITAVRDAYSAREPRVTNALARMRALAEQMILALRKELVDDLGALVGEHWTHQRALHRAITTERIDAAFTAAQRAGALGFKALGASGGGCVVAIAAQGREKELREQFASVVEVMDVIVDGHGVVVREDPDSAEFV